MARDTDMKIYLLKTSELYMQLNKELIVEREIIEGDRGWLYCFEMDKTSLIVNSIWRKCWISRYQLYYCLTRIYLARLIIAFFSVLILLYY